MRGYTVAAAAVTLGVPPKWLDNVLSRHAIPGIRRSRQGVRRLLPPPAILQLEIAILIARTLGAPLSIAIPLAAQLHDSRGHSSLGVPPILITLDIQLLTADLNRRLADAVEATPTPARGRPRRHR